MCEIVEGFVKKGEKRGEKRGRKEGMLIVTASIHSNVWRIGSIAGRAS